MGPKSMNYRIVFLSTALALLAWSAPPAKAWGCKGHQTVAWIAEKHLTAEARQLVEKLLDQLVKTPSIRS